MKKYKNIIFDLDGTISDSSEGIIESMQTAFIKNGLEVPAVDLLKTYIGPPLEETFGKYLKGEKILETVQAYREFYKTGPIFKNKLYDGMGELLLSLYEQGYKIFIATTKEWGASIKIAEQFNIKHYFTGIYGTDSKGLYTKTDVLRFLFTKHELNKTESIMIGDTLYDAEGADNLGIDLGVVLYGFGKREVMQKQKAVFYAESVSQLKNILLPN